MKAVYTLIFTLVAILNSIQLSLQSGRPRRMPSTSSNPLRSLRSIDQPRWYQDWILPSNASVQVFAEHIGRLYRLEANQEYIVLGSQDRMAFAFRIFGAPYAIYDNHDRRAAISMRNGHTRPLTLDEEDILDRSTVMFKLPAMNLQIVSDEARYGSPSIIPPSLRDIRYEDWILPFDFTIQVIQNLPEQGQRFYIVTATQKYNVLRNPGGEVFAIKKLDQVHVLYDLDKRQVALNMITGNPRTLRDDEIQYLDTRADTIKQTDTAQQVRNSMRHF